MGKAKTLNNVVINMTLKPTQTRAKLSTSSEDLAVQMGKINKWYDSLVPTGGASGNILEWDSDGVAKWVAPSFLDEKVKSTLLAQSTAEGSYRPTFVTGAGTGGVNIIDSFKVDHTPGTTSAVGNTRLVLGNATASGTANNEEGQLKLYSSGTSFHTLKGTTVSSEVIHVLPSTGGTVLNHMTTTYTQTSSSSVTGAYEIGKIKINGTTTTIYGKDTNTTYTASDGIKIESNVIKHTNSITTASSVFKKISYDAQGHITGTANVTASDIPALNYIVKPGQVGSASRPIYINNSSVPTQCDTPASGAYWTGVPYVGSNGVMKIGKYIDFHATNATTNDYDYRITAETQTLYFAPKSSGDATYNLIRMQSPDYNQIQFQTTKTGKAYTSTGIVAYPLTTSGQTMLIQSDGNTVVGGGESPRTLYSNSYDNMDTAENETLYLASDSSEIHFITNCQAYSGRKVLKVQDAQLVKSGGQWISARDVAPVYANKPNTQDGGYYPAWFAKTKSGGWSMGVLSAQDNLYITYTTDTDYSGGSNNNTYQVQFQNKSGTVALTSDIPTVNNASLTLKGAGTTVTTFTANSSTNQSLDIVAGSNVTITPDAANHKITIASSYTNTDTKVNVTLGTTTKAYLLGTSTTPTNTAQPVTSIADTGVYLDTTAGMLTATTFKAGNIIKINNSSGMEVTANTASAWARGIEYYVGSTYTSGIGARGDANAFSYLYMGKYDDNIARFYQSDKSTYFYGTVHLKENLYGLNPVESALNCHNSNITGINSLIFEDLSDNAGEGIMFYRSATPSWDVIWAKDGLLHFSPNYPTDSDNLSMGIFATTSNTDAWSSIGVGLYTTERFQLKIIRTGDTSKYPSWMGWAYSAAIAFGGADTKGVISVRYDAPGVMFIGGQNDSNHTKPNWNFGISGTNGNTYNLNNFISLSSISATNSGSGNAVTSISYSNGVITATKGNSFLPLSGGTMTGTITHPANTVAINLRDDATSTWQNTIMTQSNGDEAVVFANANARTSWMFVNGEDSIAHPENNRWQSLTPALQIKGGCVAIGKLIPSGTTPTTKLDVAGDASISGYLNTGYINMNVSDQDNLFTTASSIIYSNSDKYLRRTTFSELASLLQNETTVYDGRVIHQNDFNSAGFTRPVHRFIRSLRANKLAFTLPANITMEYSTNSGSSWTSFGYTDAQKAGPFLSRHFGGSIAIGPASGERTTSMQTRITITNDGRDCMIDQFYIWMSTSGHSTTVDIQYTTQSAKTTWVDWRTGVGLAGWAGPNVINVSELRYGKTIYSIRFIFKITSVSASYKTQSGTIYDIQAYGGMACWTDKNNMMKHDSLFTWDYEQKATFPAEIKVPAQLRVYHGNYGTLLRSDGSDTYILLTNSGSAENGTWNNLRPFQISNSTGMVYLKEGAQVSSTSYGALSVIRAGSANNAGIKFYNNGSTYLGSLALGTANGTFVRFKTDESTSYEIIDRSVVAPTPSSTVTTNWNTASERTIVVTKGWMSYWNGAYNGTSSNLAYCNKGAFGTIVTHDEGDYVKTAYNQGAYGTDYGILFTNPIAASTDTGGYAYRNAEMRAKFRPPSSSARGWAEIYLGNAETTNASGSTGWIGIYNASGKLTDLSVADGSSDTTQYFPNVSGTILNSGTTSFTRTLSSGTKIGTITINGTATDIYCETNTNTDTKVYQSSTTTSDFRPVLFGKNNQTNPENLETAVTDQAFVTKRIFAQPSTGNLYLYSTSDDSPALVFRRGTLIDNLNDWKIYVSSGALYFDQSTANASSETWTHKMYLHSSDGKLYVGSSAVSVEGHTHNYAGSSSAGGAATSANKLNTNAGSTTNPVYFTDGVPKACNKASSGVYHTFVPSVDSAGVMEVGAYIDFHSKTSTADWDLRLSEESANLLALKNTSPTFCIHSTGHTNAALELWREGDNYTDYRIINTGGQFKIQSDYIEGTGHTDWFDMLHLAYTTGNATFKGTGYFGGIITTYREGATTDDLPAGIVFSNKDTTTGLTYSGAHIYAYNDHANPSYGENLVINAGGCLFIGSGEAPDNHYAAIKSSIGTNEDIYMTADRYVYIQGCGDTIAARKGMIVYTTDSNHGNYHQILPTVADTATDNVGSIGSSSYRWHEVHAANYYGEFDCLNEVASTAYALVLALHPDTHEPNTLRKTPNAVVSFKNGTASEEGWAQITLGNENKSGTAGNSTGWLKLFSPSSGSHYITGASTTSAITHTLPAVSGTVLNSGNYLQYTRSIQKLYAAKTTKGWRRILSIPASSSSGFTIGRYEFHFTRQWNNGAPESFGVRVICNYTTPIIRLLYAEQNSQILTDFRVTRSSDSTKIHFEVWYNATTKNDFSVRYVIQDPWPIPHDYSTFPTETDGSSAGSSFLPVVSDNPTGQATITIPLGGISQFNLRQVTGTYGGYFGMADAAGSDSAWIRTTSQGLLPHQSGDATSGGHCSLGTSGWYFGDAYINRDMVILQTSNASNLDILTNLA